MKQMEVTKKKIGECTFYIKPFPAFKAATISGTIAKTLGPLLGGLSGFLKDGEDATDIMNSKMEDILPAVAGALGELDPDAAEALIQKLIVDYKNVSVCGEITENEVETLTYELADEVFCGDLMNMLRLCFEVCKVNFGGFFSNLNIQSGNLQESMDKVKKRLTSGENSTSVDSEN